MFMRRIHIYIEVKMRPTDRQLLKIKTKNLLKTFGSSDLHQFTVQHWNRNNFTVI